MWLEENPALALIIVMIIVVIVVMTVHRGIERATNNSQITLVDPPPIEPTPADVDPVVLVTPPPLTPVVKNTSPVVLVNPPPIMPIPDDVDPITLVSPPLPNLVTPDLDPVTLIAPQPIIPMSETVNPVSECQSLGGIYDVDTRQCMEPALPPPPPPTIDPVAACAELGGIYDSSTGACNEPTPPPPPPVDPQVACQDLGGYYDTATGDCLTGPLPPTADQLCAADGGVYDAATNACVPTVNLLDTEEECSAAGKIWDGQTFECISIRVAAARCLQVGGNWDTNADRCVYCATEQDYDSVNRTCVTRPAEDPAALCLASGNVWDAAAGQCVLAESRTAELVATMEPTCHGQSKILDFSLGQTPDFCIPCDLKYPGTVWDADLGGCVDVVASTPQGVPIPAIPVQGRYVRLERVANSGHATTAGNSLNIAEIIVNGPNGIRLTTPSTPITQSSVWTARDRAAKYVLDGNLSTFLHTAAYSGTDYLNNVWTEIDLGTDQAIADVIVENRRHTCCKMRARGLRIRIINSAGQDVFISDPTTTTNDTYVFDTTV